MPPSPPPSSDIAGVAFDGPLVGCTVCADINGNGGCDGGEPTAITNATGGYYLSVSPAQITAMTAEDGMILLQPGPTACIDMHSGLQQRFALATRSGGTSISPLSALPAALPIAAPASDTATFDAPPTGASMAARQSRPSRPSGRRNLQTTATYNDRMIQIRNSLDLNQSFVLATIDLSTYDVYGAVNAGQDYCLSASLLVRTSQAQSVVLQAATALQYVNPTLSFDQAVEDVGEAFANMLIGTTGGFSTLASPATYGSSSLLPSTSLGASTISAISSAMASSFEFSDMWMPNCPPLAAWERTVLNLHNTRRADHCAQPLEWDTTLAEAADVHARSCPVSMDVHSSALVNENVVVSATSGTTVEEAVSELFTSWYDAQAPSYRYDTAQGPCLGGFNYSRVDDTTRVVTYECVANTATTRATELTQMLWQTHDVMGCALSQCGLSNVLVCQYSSRGCTGAACQGNTEGDFQANVRRQNYNGPGPCLRRAWDSVINSTMAAWVGQAYLPDMVSRLLNGTMTETAFIAATTPAELASQAANVLLPVHVAMPPSPPSPPTGNMPSPPPQMPLSDVGEQQTAGPGGSGSADMGWVAGLVLTLFIVLLLVCVALVMLYRISGGEPGVWFTVHYAHGNPKISFNYATVEEREKAAEDLAIYQKAMSDAMAAYQNGFIAFWNMRSDHKNFLKAGGINAAKSGVAYAPPYAEKGGVEAADVAVAQVALEGEEKAAQEAPSKLLPDQPSIDTELDQEFAEAPEDRARRIEWIKHFVREGDLQRAFDLGWDGKPFKQAAVMRSPSDVSKAASKAPAGNVPANAPSPAPVSPRADDAGAGALPSASSSAPAAAGAGSSGAGSSGDGGGSSTEAVLHRI